MNALNALQALLYPFSACIEWQDIKDKRWMEECVWQMLMSSQTTDRWEAQEISECNSTVYLCNHVLRHDK